MPKWDTSIYRVIVDGMAGASISEFSKESLELAQTIRHKVTMLFNGIEIDILPKHDDVDTLVAKYWGTLETNQKEKQ